MHFQLKIASTYDGFMGLLGHNPILHGGRATLECPEGLQCIGASESDDRDDIYIRQCFFLNDTAFFSFSVFTTSGIYLQVKTHVGFFS